MYFFTYNINALLIVEDQPHGPSSGPRHKFRAASEPLTLTPIRWARHPHTWAFHVVDDGMVHRPRIPWVQHALYCPWACPAQHLGDSGWLDRLHTAGVHDGGMAAVPQSILVLFLFRFLPLNYRFQRSDENSLLGPEVLIAAKFGFSVLQKCYIWNQKTSL